MIDFKANLFLWLALIGVVIYIFYLFIKGHKKEAWGWVESLAVAAIYAGIIMALVVRSYYVPSASMVPSLGVNDRLIGNKFIYNFHQPRRQDVIIFEPPFVTEHQRYVKRLIGLPGDTVELRNGRVYVKPAGAETFNLLDESAYDIRRSFDDFGPVTVPEDHYFVLGDNRVNSTDGRYWRKLLSSGYYQPKDNYQDQAQWDFVPADNVEAQAMLIFWPLWRIGIVPQ